MVLSITLRNSLSFRMLKRSRCAVQKFLNLRRYSPNTTETPAPILECSRSLTNPPHIWNQRIFVRHVGSSPASVEKVSPKKEKLNFPERTVTVYTCQHIYEKWRKDKSFIYIPQHGVFATVTYIDTHGLRFDINPEKPPKTVMFIHGIPGNYRVFTRLINELSRKGFRVIVPTFPATLYLPGLSGEDQLFRHTVEEKAQVFKDFLKALQISKLDCIIAHSSAIYPALRLILDPELEVKADVFFNTGGHTNTVTMKPYAVVWLYSYLYLHPVGRRFVQKTGKFIMRYILRSPIKDDDFDGIMLLAITMVFARVWEAEQQFQEIAKRKIPTLYFFSEDDKVVERELSYKVVELLNAHQENISFYDKYGELERPGKELDWLTLLSFAEGSHYVFRKYPELCAEKVLAHLKKIEDKESCRT
ncbi:uncharacterized protein LOC129231795 [Uloborus diversus]|uniref:uncharacterized protein LOC129231795 n=1 Tax=Uloborus diversus TaxID=327109 RepID=UPI00240A7321|nr:uncharacterized protein LOC129231795 [Uloborus diversus]